MKLQEHKPFISNIYFRISSRRQKCVNKQGAANSKFLENDKELAETMTQ